MLTGFANQVCRFVKPHIRVDSAASLEEALHRLIPISAHMGIKVSAYTGTALTLTAPLSANVNHQLSAFGGSLFSIAALSGWGLLQLKFTESDIDCDTVIGKGEVTYERPVYADFECVCELPADWDELMATLRNRGRVGIRLAPTVKADGERAMVLSGQYVAIRREPTK